MPNCSRPNRLASPLWVTLFDPYFTDGDTEVRTRERFAHGQVQSQV